MKRRPYTAREVELARIGSKDMPKGARETIRRLVDTIEDLNMRLQMAQRKGDTFAPEALN